MAMIQARGGRLSKTAEKLFSSTEGTPEKAPAALRGGPDGSAKDSKEVGARGHGKRKPSDQGLAEGGSAAVAELRRRVAELEEDARSDGSRPVDAVATFAEALERQTQIMAEVLGKKSKRSTIQVSPKVSWPMLDDDCSDYRSVQEFYDTFEATIGLANDGEGMTDMEKLTTLKACLKQHRLKTYELVYRRHLTSGLVRDNPGEVYRQIRDKHLLFSETAEEKEIRIQVTAWRKGSFQPFSVR